MVAASWSAISGSTSVICFQCSEVTTVGVTHRCMTRHATAHPMRRGGPARHRPCGGGVPTRPRIGGIASSNATSWVTSLRLPPVRITARGVPAAAVIRRGLEPGRPRSTGLGPVGSPVSARRCEESTTAWARSRSPTPRSSASSVSYSRCQTPALCQAAKRRQHVAPEAPNILMAGRCSAYPYGRRTGCPPMRLSVRRRQGNR